MPANYAEYSAESGFCQPGKPGVVDSLLARIAPWRCVLCHLPAQGMDVCRACLADLPWLMHGCRRCALPIQDFAEICGHCQAFEQHIDISTAALIYEYPVDRLIVGLKFYRQLFLARVLGDLLSARLAEHLSAEKITRPDLLLPVPLHATRLATRTFNQAQEIARWIALRLDIQLTSNLAIRTKDTGTQTGLTRRLRMRNLRGAFILTGSVKNKRVAIIDDVVTTGATTNQLAKMCKAAGAESVAVWTVARTP